MTLNYAAYEPEHLKNDGKKNPLLLWIHGQGEGGTDVDIALLGNKVCSLVGRKIQSHFITEGGSLGAYVLVIQCPTYWMDGGDGENSNGDVVSRYSSIFMDTYKAYIAANEDVDESRVYVGGCSNGGYMTMNLLIQYPDVWAAAYTACEAYSYIKCKRDDNGKYVLDKDAKSPTQIARTSER